MKNFHLKYDFDIHFNLVPSFTNPMCASFLKNGKWFAGLHINNLK